MKRLLIGVMLLGAVTTAFGNEKGNGGDTIGAEFSDSAANISESITILEYKLRGIVDANEFEDLVKNVDVISESSVNIGGVERDAVNKPGQIIVNRFRWRKNSKKGKFRIILHEYLSLLGLEGSDNYDSSAKVMDIFESNRFSFDLHIVDYESELLERLSQISVVCKLKNYSSSDVRIIIKNKNLKVYNLLEEHNFNQLRVEQRIPSEDSNYIYSMRTGFRTTSYGGSSFLNKISLQSDDLKKWRGILTVPKFKRVNVVSTMFPDKGKKNITYELECESRN